jgi:octaprenyl-diphosphate synthase
MGQVMANPRASQELQTPYAPIREDLDRVEELLHTELFSDFPFIDGLVKHGFRLGGKRLRPALVLLCGKACGGLQPDHHLLAAAVELIHTATLVHDDVLDEATIRRHLETVNARWNNETSVLLGDYLFSLAVRLIGSLDTMFAVQAISEACRAMCQGELRQVATRGDFDLSEACYLEIIADKTAALCACCCRLGSHYAGAAVETQDALARFGRQLGVAFQIVDDLLDVLGDEAKTGKSLGTDVLKQKPTLPLIRLLSQAEAADRAEILSLVSRPNGDGPAGLRHWLCRSDAIAYSRQKANTYIECAVRELEILPPSAAVDSLRGVAEFVVTRQV